MTQRTKRFRFSRRCHYKFHALLMNIHSPPRHPLTSGARNAPKCKGCLGTICKGCHGPEQFKDPGRLVWATEHFAFGPSTVISADFPAWKDRNHVLEQIAAFGGTSGANLTGAGDPSRVTVTRVTTGLFSMLGLQPAAGRAFLPAEGKLGHENVALLNETLWRNRFGADPRIIGEWIRLDGVGYLVVGVMPANVRPQADVWTPLSLDADIFSAHSPRWMMLAAIGRLKPGIEISKAQSELQLLTQEMDKEYGAQAAQFRAHETVEV